MSINFKNNQLATIKTDTIEETEGVGEKIGEVVLPGQVIALIGDLGAGKTCITRGIARGVGVSPEEKVNSPTFVIMQRYSGKLTLYHSDVYRMESADDLLNLDLFEMAENDILVIEWADKFIEEMPSDTLFVELNYLSETKREINIFGVKEKFQNLLNFS